MSDVVLYEREGHVALVTLNRPERRNAMSVELIRCLGEAWRRFDADDEARVAILTGAGKAFCAGGDLLEMDATGGPSGFRQLLPGDRTVEPNTWKPVIAAVNGAAYAGGFWFAQFCDIRIASEKAVFAVSEVKWNLPAPWVTELARIIGLGHALELVLTGEPISAARAHEIGFVNRVVPHDDLMTEARKIATIIAENAPLSVRAHKEVLYRGSRLGREEADALGARIVEPLMTSEDALEGPRAFLERRKPVWKGR